MLQSRDFDTNRARMSDAMTPALQAIFQNPNVPRNPYFDLGQNISFNKLRTGVRKAKNSAIQVCVPQCLYS